MYLNCHSQFSFRYGTIKPESLLELAEKNDQKAIVLTDINNTSACLNFIREAENYNIKPLVGIDFRNGVKQQFVGIAKNNKGFKALNSYLSAFLNDGKIIPDRPSNLKNQKESFIIYPFFKYQKQLINLSKNEYIGIRVDELKQLSFSIWRDHKNHLVLMQPVTVDSKRDFNIHRLLRAIDKNTLLSRLESSELCSPSDQMYTKEELESQLADYPEIVKNTKYILDECSIHFTYKGKQKSGAVNHNKQTFGDSKEEDRKKLRQECYSKLPYRYPELRQQKEVISRLEKELKLIINQGFEAYFLINWDMLRYAREKGFFYVGRGSGANSIVAYLLQITDVDPIKLDLYFERFINPYRENPPDFDIDFSWKDRDIITNYLFEKYGEKGQIALLATYHTFSKKSLKRELGKVFGLPKKEIDDLAEEKHEQKDSDDLVQLIYRYSHYMQKIPSHLSVHAGGILISEEPIHYYSATSMPAKGYPLVQFDMIHAEDAGLYKFDILSQRGLGKIKDTLSMVVRNGKESDLDIHATERFFEDEKIKELLREGNTIGCFYVESPAMRMLLKKLKADHYLGLVAASSIIRPGVAKSGMMREYILRSQSNSEEWRKKTPQVMQDLMPETYGVMVYQEDVIKVAHRFADLSLGEADVLRRGMSGKFRSREEFAKAKQKFFDNCRRRGYLEEVITDVWRQIESFAGYAFSKGHSASYAVESYQSLYLKAHYPMEFIIGVINNGGGFYRTEVYIHEARMKGAQIELPCINRGEYLCILHKEKTIFLGFAMIRDLEKNVIQHFLEERYRNGNFKSLSDFIRRCQASIEQLTLLIRSGAFRFYQANRQALLWEMHQLMKTVKPKHRVSLFEIETPRLDLPVLDKMEYADYYEQMDLFGFPLNLPFDLVKEEMPDMLARQLPEYLEQTIQIAAYLITVKNTRTSHNESMQFGTFLDREGGWIDTVHFPEVVKQHPFLAKACYILRAKVVVEFGFYSLEVKQIQKLAYNEPSLKEL